MEQCLSSETAVEEPFSVLDEVIVYLADQFGANL